MAEYEMKDNTFTLFKNTKKDSEKHPDYTGEIMVNGKKERLSAWINEAKSGLKYISGRIDAPYEGGKKSSGGGRNDEEF